MLKPYTRVLFHLRLYSYVWQGMSTRALPLTNRRKSDQWKVSMLYTILFRSLWCNVAVTLHCIKRTWWTNEVKPTQTDINLLATTQRIQIIPRHSTSLQHPQALLSWVIFYPDDRWNRWFMAKSETCFNTIYLNKISSRFPYLDFIINGATCQPNSVFIAVTNQTCTRWYTVSLLCNVVKNHQPHDCLLNR